MNDNIRTILHCDANNFYATVECALNPELQGKPVAVSGNPDKRHGIILAKSTLAKSFGVSTGETIWAAKKKCPDLILLAPHYDEYVKYSDKLFNMYCEYTDRVEPFGIDECWLDCTQSLSLFGSGANIANTLRARVKNELNLTISAGVSFSKIFAKLASDIKKPDATTIVSPDNYQKIVWKLPASDLLMVGRKTADKLCKMGIFTIGDIAKANEQLLKEEFGVGGTTLKNYANGMDNLDVRYSYEKHIPESIGNSTTTPKDIVNISQAEAVVLGLCEMIATRLRSYNFSAGGIYLGIKYNDLSRNGKQVALPQPTNNAKTLTKCALDILQSIYTFGSDLPLRAIAVSTFKLSNGSLSIQDNIFGGESLKINSLENQVDRIRQKYGYNSFKKGIMFVHEEFVDDLEITDFQPFKK